MWMAVWKVWEDSRFHHSLFLLHVEPCRVRELESLVGPGTPPLNFDLSGNVQAK